MRWNIRPGAGGHDPRQIDVFAVIAMLLIIIAVGHFLGGPAKTRISASFVEPSQTVRW